MIRYCLFQRVMHVYILACIIVSISKADLANDLQYSRQTAITKSIDKVSNAVVGINVTQLKKQKVNPFFDPFWGGFLPYTKTFKV